MGEMADGERLVVTRVPVPQVQPAVAVVLCAAAPWPFISGGRPGSYIRTECVPVKGLPAEKEPHVGGPDVQGKQP